MSGKVSERKVVGRTVALALGIIIIVLLACLIGAVASYTSTINGKDDTISSRDSQISNLQIQKNQIQTWLDGNKTLLNQTKTWVTGNLTRYISQMNALQNQISILNATITSLQSQITELEAEKNVTITNWPMQYYDFSFDLNMSWTSGFGGIYLSSAIPTECSRVFITMHPIGMQAGADATVNVTLMDVSWAPTNSVDYGDEWVTQTLTIYRYETTQFSWLRPMPYEIKTKAPNFIMAFYVTASAPSGWVLMNIYVYQRNE